MPRLLSDEEIKQFHQDGYLLLRSLFSNEEIGKLYRIAKEDAVISQNAVDLNDRDGKKTKLTLWFNPGEDVYSMVIRSERMVIPASQLMDGTAPVCHFHTKLMQKEPRVGGAWEWHQDYGYWYKNQFLFPDQLLSVMVALTPANEANGCLQVVRGSHKCGRLNHGFAGEQVGADRAMVDHLLKTMDTVFVVMEPGDALFFHSNLLHRSAANLSDSSRWSLISCYNLLSNPAYNDESTSWKIPVEPVGDHALMLADIGGAKPGSDFLKKEKDPALQDTGWEKSVPS